MQCHETSQHHDTFQATLVSEKLERISNIRHDRLMCRMRRSQPPAFASRGRHSIPCVSYGELLLFCYRPKSVTPYFEVILAMYHIHNLYYLSPVGNQALCDVLPVIGKATAPLPGILCRQTCCREYLQVCLSLKLRRPILPACSEKKMTVPTNKMADEEIVAITSR
jgi:hypothetical protein